MRRTAYIILDLLAVGVLLAVGLLLYYGRQEPPDLALERIRAAGVLRVATDATYPPFESYVAGEYRGYDIELAGLVAARLGVRVEFSNIPSDSLYQALAEDRVDMIASALPFIYERSNDLIYSRPYFNAAPLLVVPAMSEVRDLSAVSERVGVQLGSDGDAAARRWLRDHPADEWQLTSFEAATGPLDALAARQVVAALADPVEFTAWAATHPGYVAATSVGEANYVLAVGQQSRGLAREVDATIGAAQANGTLLRMADRWFRPIEMHQ